MTASLAASSMSRTAPKRFFSTHSGATSRQHEMWYLPGSVWKAGMLIFDEKTFEQIFIQPRHIILPSVLRIRILIYRFIVHSSYSTVLTDFHLCFYKNSHLAQFVAKHLFISTLICIYCRLFCMHRSLNYFWQASLFMNMVCKLNINFTIS